MTQQITNLAERGAVSQHLGGQPMAKLVGSGGGGLDAGAFERMPNDGPYAARPNKSANRGFGAQKYAATGATRPPPPQIPSGI